jgi:hypothetical protein
MMTSALSTPRPDGAADEAGDADDSARVPVVLSVLLVTML